MSGVIARVVLFALSLIGAATRITLGKFVNRTFRGGLINDDYYSRGDNWKSPPKGLNKKEL